MCSLEFSGVVKSDSETDELTITVDSPPQTARHEGYETAFLDMPSMTVEMEA